MLFSYLQTFFHKLSSVAYTVACSIKKRFFRENFAHRRGWNAIAHDVSLLPNNSVSDVVCPICSTFISDCLLWSSRSQFPVSCIAICADFFDLSFRCQFAKYSLYGCDADLGEPGCDFFLGYWYKALHQGVLNQF